MASHRAILLTAIPLVVSALSVAQTKEEPQLAPT